MSDACPQSNLLVNIGVGHPFLQNALEPTARSVRGFV